MEKCPNCGKELQQLNPPIEDYFNNKFVIKVPFTNWKFCLIEDFVKMGCLDCEEQERDDRNEEIYYAGVDNGYDKGCEAGYQKAMKDNG